MEITEVARSMRARMPWFVAKKIFKGNEVSIGQGWDRTEAKIAEADYSAEVRSSLIESLRDHIVCGEKFVKYYSLENSQIERLRKAVESIEIPQSIFSIKYPYSLTEDELTNVELDLIPTAIERYDDGIAAILCSTRFITIREQIEKEEFPDLPDNIFDKFDELVGFKRKFVQAYDAIWIPNKGNHVEILADFPGGMWQDMVHTVHSKLKRQINMWLEKDLIEEPVNLFPLIDSMYSKADEGRVVELGFSTTTGSVKLEKMRRSSDCLRRETYHVGGKQALAGAIEPFRLSIVWPLVAKDGRSSAPELSLVSTSRGVSAGAPLVTGASVRKCIGRSDFDHVRSRVYTHLARTADQTA